jgi:hypothetical protein
MNIVNENDGIQKTIHLLKENDTFKHDGRIWIVEKHCEMHPVKNDNILCKECPFGKGIYFDRMTLVMPVEITELRYKELKL